MKTICNSCSHQESDGKGGVQCGIPKYKYIEGYGPFKQGCQCIHDTDLVDYFRPRTGEEINIQNMSSILNSRGEEITKLKEKVFKLEQRLINIDT